MYKNGDIVYVYYWKRTPVSGDDVMRATSGLLSEFLHNYQIARYHGQNEPDVVNAYSAMQQKARTALESHGERIGIPTQIGQAESKEYIRKLQSTPEFIRWDDPLMIQTILEQ